MATMVQAAPAASVLMMRLISILPLEIAAAVIAGGSVTPKFGASPSPSLHVRSVLNDARSSSVKYCGCSHAEKWQP